MIMTLGFIIEFRSNIASQFEKLFTVSCRL